MKSHERNLLRRARRKRKVGTVLDRRVYAMRQSIAAQGGAHAITVRRAGPMVVLQVSGQGGGGGTGRKSTPSVADEAKAREDA